MALPLHRTKIVATIGPASSSRAILEQMISAGMNIARLNSRHSFARTAYDLTAPKARRTTACASSWMRRR